MKVLIVGRGLGKASIVVGDKAGRNAFAASIALMQVLAPSPDDPAACDARVRRGLSSGWYWRRVSRC
jgi:hypothetical protein